MSKLYALASLSMAIGVGCGAFGAHGLREVVTPNDLQIWEKAVFYQLIHGLAALAVVLTPETLIPHRKSRFVATLFLLGTLIFSGSLYLLVLSGQRWLGAITPLGGTSYIAGWIILAVAACRAPKHP